MSNLMVPALMFWPALLLASPQRGDTVRARLVTIVGESSAATPAFFGEISGFAFDAAGRLYVTDFKEPRVTILDQAGKQLAILGRKGKGPGEFEAPTGPAFGPDGKLFVRNMDKVLRFRVDSKSGLATVYDTGFALSMNVGWRSKAASVMGADGVLMLPATRSMRAGPTYYSFLRYTATGVVRDTLKVPDYTNTPSTSAGYMVSERSGRMVKGLNVAPFAPAATFAATPQGTIVSGTAELYVLTEVDATGKVLRQLRRDAAAARIPEAERAESARALKRRIDSLPVPVEQLHGTTDDVRKQRLPMTYPAYTGVVSGANGEAWVRRWARVKGTTVFDVFDAKSAFARTVVVPGACAPEPAPVIRAGRFACLVVDAETGEEAILLAGVPGK